MADAVPQPETIQRLGNAPFPSFAMVAGMQLELFTPLGNSPMTAAQLAEALDVRESKLAPLLYALVSAGLLKLDGDRFANAYRGVYPDVHQRARRRRRVHGTRVPRVGRRSRVRAN